MRKTPLDRIAELEQQQEQLKARIQRERAKARAAERKADTRRKIVAGALALEHAKKDDAFGRTLYAVLEQHVTRPDERDLFGFAPLPQAPADSAPADDGLTDQDRAPAGQAESSSVSSIFRRR